MTIEYTLSLNYKINFFSKYLWNNHTELPINLMLLCFNTFLSLLFGNLKQLEQKRRNNSICSWKNINHVVDNYKHKLSSIKTHCKPKSFNPTSLETKFHPPDINKISKKGGNNSICSWKDINHVVENYKHKLLH